MPYNNRDRRVREKRLRAKYRKKIWTVAIIMLIVGLIAGFVACVYSVRNFDRVAELVQVTGEKDYGFVRPTPAPEATQETWEMIPEEDDADETALIAVPTLEIVEEPIATATPIAVAPATTELVLVSPEEALAASEGVITFVADEEPVSTFLPENVEVTPEPTAEPTAEPTVEPTEEPTPEPTAEPTPEPTVEPVIVPYGEAYTLQTQIKADGSARREADADAFETLNLTLEVEAYKDPAYFEANYADSYNLQGNEAAVEFDITLNGYEGSAEIIPQNFLLITFCGEDESVASQGFQLMDTEIAGKTDIAIASDETSTLYKRYPYNADQGDMVYMVVNTYNDGVEATYWFEIQAPEGSDAAEASANSGIQLTVGSKGDDVTKLQSKLIEMGLLSGQPDGKFGNYTAGAVKEMQRRYGMEQTGIADQAFLDKLYE